MCITVSPLNCRSADRIRLLDGLHSLEESGRQYLRVPQAAENAEEAHEDFDGLECMVRRTWKYGSQHGVMYGSETTLHGLRIFGPSTRSKVVAVYFHSSVVELKRLVQLSIQHKPCRNFEDALVSSLKALDEAGLTGPFKFQYFARKTGGRLWSPLVDNLALALQMRLDALSSH